jgi:hypothetical protein
MAAGKTANRRLVFISYSSRDREPAERLVAEIESIGIPCWMAPRDIPSGASYGKEIVDALEAAEIFVVLLSTHSNSSIHVANEIERAVNYQKMIVPLRLENVAPSREIELHISARQWVDLFEGPRQRELNMRRFLNVLRDVLRAWIVPDLAPLPKPGPETPLEPPPPSGPNPKLRDTILAAVEKSGTAGPQSIAISLYRAHGEPLIPELCAMLVDESVPSFRRGPLYDVLKICSAQSKARTYSSRVFTTMLECVQKGGSDLVKATEVVGALPIPPEEKWRGLFDLFPAVHLNGGVSLLKTLLQVVPPGHRDELCTALTELLPMPDPKFQIAVIDSLRKLAYKAATPALRDLAEMSLDREVIWSAAECLAAWGDTASAPILRQVLTGCADGFTWRVLAVSLHKLEGPAAARFLVDQFPALTEEIQWEVLRWDDSWDALKAANTRVLRDVLQRLAKGALRDEMKELAALRLARLSS